MVVAYRNHPYRKYRLHEVLGSGQFVMLKAFMPGDRAVPSGALHVEMSMYLVETTR
jgi:hypothetical protein